MNRIMTGQVLMILCCMVYLAWWYRGFYPGINVNRVGGINGILLLITAGLGIAGIVLSLTPVLPVSIMKADSVIITAGGVTAYIVLLLVTKICFHRVVTTELFLIVGWTVLEMVVITRLDAAGMLGRSGLFLLCLTVAAAIISVVLYVAYYRMEAMKAFYAAMVPLVTEAAAMLILIAVVVMNR